MLLHPYRNIAHRLPHPDLHQIAVKFNENAAFRAAVISVDHKSFWLRGNCDLNINAVTFIPVNPPMTLNVPSWHW